MRNVLLHLRVWLACVLPLAALASDLTHQNATRAHPGLVSWWKMDDAGWRDYSGNDYHGTAANNPLLAPGKIGMAYLGDGATSTQRVSFTGSKLSIPGHITLAGWVRLRIVPPSGGFPRLLDRASSTLLSIDNTPRAFVRLGATSGAKDIAGATTLSTNQWYHLCVTYNGATQILYLNGNVDGSLNWAGSMHAGTTWTTWNGSTPKTCIDGMLDDLRIYDRALSDNEVRQLWADTNLAYWREPKRWKEMLAMIFWRLP